MVVVPSVGSSTTHPDPIETKLVPPAGRPPGLFGYAVAIEDGTVAVGEAGRSVFVYRPDAGGVDAIELSPSEGPVPGFGGAVAIDGGVVVVGASRDGAGSVYRFEPDGAGGYTETKLTPSDGQADDRFGYSVAADQGTIVVGAITADANGIDSGSAYLYRSNGAGGFSETKLTATDGAAEDNFGSSVAVAGETIVVGATDDDDGGTDSGSAYLFQPDGVGGYTETKLTADDAEAGDQFGQSTAAAPDVIVIGAPGRDADGMTNVGAVYVYRPDGQAGWTSTRLATTTPLAFADTGLSVATDGRSVVAGAPGADEALLFELGRGNSPVDVLRPSDGEAGDLFGLSVGIENSTVVVGSPFHEGQVGAAYRYRSSTATCDGRTVTIDLNLGQVPTAGDDVILGTPSGDLIVGGNGNDVICGQGGDDRIVGGPGDDRIIGGPGGDWLAGNSGDDVIVGNGDADLIYAGSGNDFVRSGNGDDTVYGNGGRDLLLGGNGDDIIYGGGGNDHLLGQDGRDFLSGQGGRRDRCDVGDDGSGLATSSCERIFGVP
jgi:Ca2+-binding RTX toxin-like protein